MRFFSVAMTTWVAHATVFIFHVNTHVISALFENKLNKKYLERTYFDQKMTKNR